MDVVLAIANAAGRAWCMHAAGSVGEWGWMGGHVAHHHTGWQVGRARGSRAHSPRTHVAMHSRCATLADPSPGAPRVGRQGLVSTLRLHTGDRGREQGGGRTQAAASDGQAGLCWPCTCHPPPHQPAALTEWPLPPLLRAWPLHCPQAAQLCHGWKADSLV